MVTTSRQPTSSSSRRSLRLPPRRATRRSAWFLGIAVVAITTTAGRCSPEEEGLVTYFAKDVRNGSDLHLPQFGTVDPGAVPKVSVDRELENLRGITGTDSQDRQKEIIDAACKAKDA